MNLNEINFTFGGKHCLTDFGCIWVEKTGHAMTPKIKRNTYEIAGHSGTLLMPGESAQTFPLEGELFFVQDPPDQYTAQKMLRRVTAWLLDGRQQLIFDYEPEVYLLAEVNEETKWSFSNWIDGGLTVKFEAQPYVYNVQQSTTVMSVLGDTAQLTLAADTGLDAPLAVQVDNLGSAVLSGLDVVMDGKMVKLDGMAIPQGSGVTICMDVPAGVTYADGTDGMAACVRFDPLLCAPGRNAISITLRYGSGTQQARISAMCRGRWR